MTFPLPTELAKILSSHEKPFSGLHIALIFDVPAPLTPSSRHPFPSDATAEWETQQTLDTLASTWLELGFRVSPLALNSSFFSNWEKNFSQFDLVHSVVEGWGSESREAWVPSLCELSGVPFVGAAPLGQCVAMRKSLLKLLCSDLGIPVAKSYRIEHLAEFSKIPAEFLAKPHFLKPDSEGSGMGVDAAISLCQNSKETLRRLEKLLVQYPDGVLVEEHLPGEEWTTAFLGSPATALPSARIEVETGVYGLANKSKELMGEKVSFNGISQAEEKQLRDWGARLIKACRFHDFVRFDWKKDANGRVTFLEANPLAGLSYYYSVLPKMAAQAGLSYRALLAVLAHSALTRKEARTFWYGMCRLQNQS
jgi:D-alanine-D-alanine ligase